MQRTPRLRELRERAALSQEDLAEKSGVARATIHDLEAEKRPARPSTIRKLATALGVEVGELYPKVPSQPTLEDVPEEARAQLVERGFSDAYFVPLKEGEVEDVVTLRINVVRLLHDNDRLLRSLREAKRQNAALAEQLAQAKASESSAEAR